MNARFRTFAVILVLACAMLACSSSFVVVETPVSAPDQAATPTDVPAVVEYLFPHPLYFLGRDDESLAQVYRLERDGKTQTQLTFEPVDVSTYDVSPVDGSLAFEANNELILVNADGSNRRVLAQNGRDPVFSPDGRTLAFSLNGVNLYDLSSGTSARIFENHPMGGSLPPEIYIPDRFSPDGTKLLIEVGHPPDSPWTAAIYIPATNTLMQFGGDDQSLSCCVYYGGAQWSADSSSLYTVATTPDSSAVFGELWKVDPVTGAVTTLIHGSAGEGETRMLYLPYEPYLAPDGQLYFFSAKYPESAGYSRRVPFLMVRSKPEDITMNWTVLRPETFELMNEALWAPDGSLVIVAKTTDAMVFDGGVIELYYTDGTKGMLSLLPFGEQLKWGP